MEKKYQVFISSTFLDLKEERVELMEALINLGHIPVGMELFNAADDTQWGVIKRRIDESDYYVLLISDRYGSIDKDGVGFTEKEYNYAFEIKKPVISFVRSEQGISSLLFEHRESNNKQKLDLFKKKVSTHLYKLWDNKHDLSKKFFLSFAELIREKPQSGWVRFDSISQENKIQFNQLFSENQKLTEENRALNSELKNVQTELDNTNSLKNEAKNLIKVLPKKFFVLGDHKFNGIELIGLFGGFVGIQGPLEPIVDSIKEFLITQTKDEESWTYRNKNSIKYIVGSFASLGLIEIKSETCFLNHEDSRKGAFYSKKDTIETLQTVFPKPLLTEIYSQIESVKIDQLLTVQTKSEYLKKKKRLDELSDFKGDTQGNPSEEVYLQRRQARIQSVISEFMCYYEWNSDKEKMAFYESDFANNQFAFADLFNRANSVLETLKEKTPKIDYDDNIS